MTTFKTLSPDSQTLGASLLTWVEASPAFKQRMMKIMKENGI